MYINSSSPISHMYPPMEGNTTNKQGTVKQGHNVDSVHISSEAKNEMKWESIGKKYDLNNISENERLSLADELFNEKLISEEQHLMMNFSLKNINNLNIEGITFDPNKKYDHLSATEFLLETSIKGGGTAQGIDFAKETLSIFNKLNSYS